MNVWWPRLAAVLGALSFSVVAWAEPKWWMKNEDPNSLYFHYSQDRLCPGSYEDAVAAALVRSRIKREEHWIPGELVLYVNVVCMATKPASGFAYSIDVRFGRFFINPKDPTDIEIALYGPSNYGVIGTSSKDGGRFIRDTVRNSVESALTDYLKANFDL